MFRNSHASSSDRKGQPLSILSRPELPPPNEGRFDLLLLPAAQLMLLRYLGEVKRGQVLEGMRDALGRQPECATWGVVADMRRFTGHLGVEGINAVVALRRNAWPDLPPSREVLLSFDPGMGFLASYLDVLKPEVAHSVGTDPEAACRLVLPPGTAVPAEALAFLGVAR